MRNTHVVLDQRREHRCVALQALQQAVDRGSEGIVHGDEDRDTFRALERLDSGHVHAVRGKKLQPGENALESGRFDCGERGREIAGRR